MKRADLREFLGLSSELRGVNWPVLNNIILSSQTHEKNYLGSEFLGLSSELKGANWPILNNIILSLLTHEKKLSWGIPWTTK